MMSCQRHAAPTGWRARHGEQGQDAAPEWPSLGRALCSGPGAYPVVQVTVWPLSDVSVNVVGTASLVV
jgi:hypothetical protein